MAAAVPSRRPKLSLQINPTPVTSLQPSQKSKPVLSLPISAVNPSRKSRLSYGSNLSDSEEDAKFWSGEDVSSATSSEDEEIVTKHQTKITMTGNTVVLPSPSVTSPFLPPATGMRFPTPAQRPGMTKLRLLTAIPPVNTVASPVVAPQSRQKLSLSIPSHSQCFPPLPRRLGVLPSPISPVIATPPALRKVALSNSTKPRKSVTFSTQPDVVISTEKYTISNSDLLEYLSSEDCSEMELSQTWGMTLEEGRMLRVPRSAIDRRERKWIGLTNSFMRGKKRMGEDEDEE
jgi:hypothetical protein